MRSRATVASEADGAPSVMKLSRDEGRRARRVVNASRHEASRTRLVMNVSRHEADRSPRVINGARLEADPPSRAIPGAFRFAAGSLRAACARRARTTVKLRARFHHDIG